MKPVVEGSNEDPEGFPKHRPCVSKIFRVTKDPHTNPRVSVFLIQPDPYRGREKSCMFSMYRTLVVEGSNEDPEGLQSPSSPNLYQ